jgi:RND superfamily putative drug exporter
MQGQFFYAFGKLVYHLRWFIICAWLALIVFCIPIVPHVVSVFKSTGFSADHSASVQAEKFIQDTFGYGNNKFIVMYTSREMKFSNPRFMNDIKKSLSTMNELKIKYEIIYPDSNKQQVSKDKHSAYAVILLKQAEMLTGENLKKFQSLILTPRNMTVEIGGEPVFVEHVNKQTQVDLFNADYIAAPVTIIMMLIIFESIIGALVPVIVGGGCSLMILCILYVVGRHYDLSVFTLNIALLLGLCLSLDYALFIISRFRYELRNGHSAKEAVALTQATAGKAVFFSGLAVFVSLCALLFFPINILFSVGVGGLSAVFVAVITANVVLPSILAVLNHRLNFLSIKMLTPTTNGQSPLWHWLVTNVVKRPIVYFVVIMAMLLTLSFPVLHAKFGVSDYRILPPHSPSRAFFDDFDRQFNINVLTPIQLIVQTQTPILADKNISKLQMLSKKINHDDLVDDVSSIISAAPDLTSQQSQAH